MRKGDRDRRDAGNAPPGAFPGRVLDMMTVFLRLTVFACIPLLLLEGSVYLSGRREYQGYREQYVKPAELSGEDAGAAPACGAAALAGSEASAGNAGSAGAAALAENAAFAGGAALSVDFAALQELNPDVAAWLTIPGTPVDYPVLRREGDTGYYLTHTLNGTRSRIGAVHLDAACSTESRNMLIYGHNLLDGSMFSALNSYRSREFWEKHKDIWLYLPDGSARHYLAAAVVVTDREDAGWYLTDFADEESAGRYYDSFLENSIFDTGIGAPEVPGQSIVLSTCYGRERKRLILGFRTG